MDKNKIRKVSVVIPVRNRMENLKNLIKSLLRQTLSKKDFEIIVVDYGGDDKTESMLEKFRDKRIRYIYVPEKGVWNLPRARNVGIRNSFGELVFCIDGDMKLDPDVLEKVYLDFEKREKDGKQRVLYQIPRREILKNGEIKLYSAGPFPGDFQATHRDNWFKVRGFDERMTGYGYEDGDLVIRMKRAGVPQYWMSSEIKTYHQYHPQSAAEEVYVNMVKSLLNFSYKANDLNWGSKERKTFKLHEKIIIGIDRLVIMTIIRPIKRIKRFVREIRREIKDQDKD